MTTPHVLASGPVDSELIESYARLGATPAAIENRRKTALRFTRLHNGIETWADLPVVDRLAEPVVMRTYAAWAAVEHGMAVDADYVVGTSTHWSNHVQEREPAAHSEFVALATDLGFNPSEINRMWATLAKLSVISGIPAGVIADGDYTRTCGIYLDAIGRRCGTVPKIFSTPVFCLNSVMFHLHRGPAPRRRTRDGNRKPDWDALHRQRRNDRHHPPHVRQVHRRSAPRRHRRRRHRSGPHRSIQTMARNPTRKEGARAPQPDDRRDAPRAPPRIPRPDHRLGIR